jgi:hypothetical protein
MFVYHYGDEGISDSGWGCVYRNIQSAVKFYGEEAFGRSSRSNAFVPSLPFMISYFGLEGNNGKDLWIEPIDACNFLTVSYEIPTRHIFLKRNGVEYFTRTDVESLESFESVDEVVDILLKHVNSGTTTKIGEGKSIIIDDGVYSYILFSCGNPFYKGFFRGDPHCSFNRDVKLIGAQDLLGENLSWAFCLVG